MFLWNKYVDRLGGILWKTDSVPGVEDTAKY
jgi:hypothetical protein